MSNDLIPQTPEERKWASTMHAAALIGLLLAPGLVLGPLIVWFLKKGDSQYLNEQGKKAINFQLTILLIVFIFALLSAIIKPLLAIAFMTGIGGIIFAGMAAFSVYKNGDFEYPFSLSIIK